MFPRCAAACFLLLNTSERESRRDRIRISEKPGSKGVGAMLFSRRVIRDDEIHEAEIIFLNDRVICSPKVGWVG